MAREPIFALTSFSPAPHSSWVVRECIQSWRNAGLHVFSFNHPSEIPKLEQIYDVDVVSVYQTAAPVFGRHLVPIKVMLDWAFERSAPVLLINSDIYLSIADWELKRARWVSEGGLCYFIRHNYHSDIQRAVREPFGIDAFLLDGKAAGGFPDSYLSMGQPFWDYWVPHVFAAAGRPIYSIDFPAAFHRSHPRNWTWESWHHCALEFDRTTHLLDSDRSLDACLTMSWRVRQDFDRNKISLSQRPLEIRQWVRQKFNYRGPKTFLELGAHQGTDTAWMAQIPDVFIHAFEPDPRNQPPSWSNVRLHRAAVSERDGSGELILSQQGWGQLWTHSSSIKAPKNHLVRYPVTFGGVTPVQLLTLDSFSREHGLELIDFIWADIQGAEGDMIRGGQETLARTRYLYTEYSDDELYEGQITLKEILALLPDFHVLELWPEDVLLENRKLAS